MKDVLLFGHRDSGHACKVALALALAQVPHRRETVDIWAPAATRPAAFRAASPFAEVPALVLPSGEALVQSGSILHEIATRTGRLGGQDPALMRRIRELLLWEANRIGMCLPQLVEALRAGAEPFPPGAVEWLRGRWAVDRARFDTLLGGGPFFCGPAPTVADCAIWGYVERVEAAGEEPTPAMARWRDRIRALPGWMAPAAMFP